MQLHLDIYQIKFSVSLVVSICLSSSCTGDFRSTLRIQVGYVESFFEKGPHTSFSLSLSLSLVSLFYLSPSFSPTVSLVGLSRTRRHATCPRLITQSHVSFALTDPNQAANNNHVNSVSEGLPESGAKTFYENLPFHGIQAPPNKVSMYRQSHPSLFQHDHLYFSLSLSLFSLSFSS